MLSKTVQVTLLFFFSIGIGFVAVELIAYDEIRTLVVTLELDQDLSISQDVKEAEVENIKKEAEVDDTEEEAEVEDIEEEAEVDDTEE